MSTADAHSFLHLWELLYPRLCLLGVRGHGQWLAEMGLQRPSSLASVQDNPKLLPKLWGSPKRLGEPCSFSCTHITSQFLPLPSPTFLTPQQVYLYRIFLNKSFCMKLSVSDFVPRESNLRYFLCLSASHHSLQANFWRDPQNRWEGWEDELAEGTLHLAPKHRPLLSNQILPRSQEPAARLPPLFWHQPLSTV